jgi:hypothetical protein
VHQEENLFRPLRSSIIRVQTCSALFQEMHRGPRHPTRTTIMYGGSIGTLQEPKSALRPLIMNALTSCSRSFTDKQALRKEPNGKQAFVRVSEIGRTFSNPAVGQPLHRFYFRSAVGVLGPIIVSAYFIVIWRIYLVPSDAHSPLAFGPPGATYVFYSWFIAGVVGLNLSLYGLAGVEAAMLMESAWNVGDAMRLMMHADRTWSGPGGWLKMLNWIAQKPTFGAQRKFPGRLWFVLAIPSVLIFVAWPPRRTSSRIKRYRICIRKF